ncbi:signal peptidase I [Lacticaseibacillus absianus]|uniref:signal peptidase I n=1 Tax=Lacticaseibacillus absianus TaxID=2729623 RepID=UPI0015C814D0|nr:signal peptidase I [Lacticaseibacillus absianus]
MKEEKGGFLRWLIELIVLIAVVVLGTQLLIKFVISKDIVQGTSMQPTLQDGDRLYSLRHKKVKRNAIVVIEAPDAPGELYIKRVIGMPGDTVRVQDEKLYVNGKQQTQPYLNTKFMKQEIAAWAKTQGVAADSVHFTQDFNIATLAATKSATVPANSYFVMGDNRLVSHDGRAFGFIKQSKVQSVVVWRYWPLNKMKLY